MTALLRHERIRTTEPKAQELQREVERLIGHARANDLSAKKRVHSTLYDRDVSKKMFAELVPRYRERPGGFTRIVKLQPRKGDGAPMALIELVQ
jgi:large subunit ribosomal protein L17